MSGKPLHLDKAQVDDIKALHREFRNEFNHFTPKGWGIEIALLQRLVETAVQAMAVLMEHSHVLYNLDEEQRQRLAHRLSCTQSSFSERSRE
jgi:hypothetical protein